MVPLLHSVVILTNSSTTALLKDSKKSYLKLSSKFQMQSLVRSVPERTVAVGSVAERSVISVNNMQDDAGAP